MIVHAPPKIPPHASGRDDWKTARAAIDAVAVATGLLGPPAKMVGGRPYWRCPTPEHEDRDPSFSVDPARRLCRCWGCGWKGDAAALVMLVKGITFPEAKAFLTGRPATPGRGPDARQVQVQKVQNPGGTTVLDPDQARPGPSGMAPEAAAALVADAAARLWAPEGRAALAHLRGRGLRDETIRAARLGSIARAMARRQDGSTFPVAGIVVPWYAAGRLVLVKVRQPDGRRPKYAELFRAAGTVPLFYPDPDAVRPGCAVALTEGEFDALALAQEIGELAVVVTRGSASNGPVPPALGLLSVAPAWFIATDADEAGDLAAGVWLACSKRAHRVRPPAPHKDWCKALAGGIDLRRLWSDALTASATPASAARRTEAPPGPVEAPAEPTPVATQTEPPTEATSQTARKLQPVHADAPKDLLARDPLRTPSGALVYSDPAAPPIELFDGPCVRATDSRRSSDGAASLPPRPAGSPVFGWTHGGRLVELATRTAADEAGDPTKLVTAPGWPAWYPRSTH
jgi:hypothetical protein